MTTPGPDWYPDPADSRQERWWDGTAWTPHTRPAGAAVPDAGTAAAVDCNPQYVRRTTVGTMATIALVTIGNTLAGFWGAIAALSTAVITAAICVFWLPEWRHQKTLTAGRPGVVHDSALWWGGGTLSEGTRLNPLHPISARRTRIRGTIAIYPGYLVHHADEGTTAIRAPGPVAAHRTHTTIWLHTNSNQEAQQRALSWSLSYDTNPDGLLEALKQAGF